VITRSDVIDAPLSAFYRDLMTELSQLMRRGGTVEGACRVLKNIGQRHQVSQADAMPLPRPSRAAQRAHKIREMYPEQPAKATAIDRRATA
ncbi:hypothetical protein, partial [Mycolicibacterium sp.]|uniref:hypothetical protein n=1 Tax=Mycolicibacterium sp. TaxID=2320850 RepID=UPI0035607C1C